MNAISLAKGADFLTVTIDDENAVREELELEPIEEATRNQVKQEAFDHARSLLPPPPSKDGIGDGTPSKTKPGVAGKKFAFAASRPLRASERVLDLAGMESYLDKGREDFEQRLRPLVAKLVVHAIPDVKHALRDNDPTELARIPLDTSEIDTAVGKWLEEVRATGYATVQKERFRGGSPIRMAEPKPPEDSKATKTIDALRQQVVRRMANRIRGELESAAGDVVRTNGDPEDVVARVMQRQLETGALQGEAGSVLTKTFNVGREEFAEEDGDNIESVELTAVLDKATCGPCDRLDGEQFDFESDEHLAHIPPLSNICDGGDNCRCLLIYNFKNSEN